MCGIAGYIGKTENPSDCLTKMAQAINHRGPDNSGIWTDEEEILDLEQEINELQRRLETCNSLVQDNVKK